MSESSNSGVQFSGGQGPIIISGSAMGEGASVVNVDSTVPLAARLGQLRRLVQDDAGSEQERQAGLAAVDWLGANATADRAPADADEHLGTIRRVSARAWEALSGIAKNASGAVLAGWLTDLITRH